MRFVFVLALVCLIPVPTAGLEYIVTDAFSTESITPFQVASLAIDLEEPSQRFLLGLSDGSIVRAGRSGDFLHIVPASLIGGRYSPVGHGLAVAQSVDRLYALTSQTYNGTLAMYTRSGEFSGGLFILGGGASFVGACFEDSGGGGLLHVFWQYVPMIVSVEIDANANRTSPIRQIFLPGIAEQRRAFTGLAYVPAGDFFLVSQREGLLLTVRRSTLQSERHWNGEVLFETDLRPLGIQSVEDIAFDASSSRLLLTDPEQRMIFELALVPQVPFHRGDPDASGAIEIADAVFLFGYLFGEGSDPSCLESADANDDGGTDVSDGIFLLRHLFTGGAPPPAPGPPGFACGVEADLGEALFGLGCAAYDGCRE